MPLTLDALTGQLLGEPGAGLLLSWAMGQFYVFLLVLVRMSGLVVIGPFFGNASIPPNIRALLALWLAILAFPNLIGTMPVESLPAPPSTLLDLAWAVLGELLIGLFLSFGVILILTGVQMAGDMFDQQAGTALAEIFNPTFNNSAAPTGQLLFMLASVIFLTAMPVAGHLQMVLILFDSFQSIPVGQLLQIQQVSDVLMVILQQSLKLSLQLAAPLLAAMSLVSMTMGFLGHTVPQINVLVMGFPIRMTLALMILIMTVSGMSHVIINHINHCLDLLHVFLSS